MIEISPGEFVNFNQKEYFIFFFSIPGLCGLCNLQEKEYEKLNVPNVIKVSGTITDEEYFMETLGIQALPCSIIFDKDGNKKTVKYGVQYEKQIKELLKDFEK